MIRSQIIPSVGLDDKSPRLVAAEFRRLLAGGAKLLPAGEAKSDPEILLQRGHTPKYSLSLFGTRFYFTNVRQNPALRFLVAYVVPPHRKQASARIYPRIFYKDLSLIWRCASHMIANEGDFWIGKGDVITVQEGGETFLDSLESTTDLPLEIQTAIESLNRKLRKVPFDEEAFFLVLRNGPAGRITPYDDFTGPRRRAAADPRNLINGGRSVATFKRKNDPSSLCIVQGFEPDFRHGIVEKSRSTSAMYGGKLRRFRILSVNRQIQYLFVAGPRHAWVIPPQALTSELSSYGVRTIDVRVDEDLCVPGYEYHYFGGDDPSEHFTQIPEGFAGEPSQHDPDRADASAWLDLLPIIRQFRRQVL